ncbi:MAG: hypothetical protein EAZ44_02375 [Cytophagia bacterium]|nr:MAG: hypothetical protein EAZ44_02375 [Cytophagia bacterium]
MFNIQFQFNLIVLQIKLKNLHHYIISLKNMKKPKKNTEKSVKVIIKNARFFSIKNLSMKEFAHENYYN